MYKFTFERRPYSVFSSSVSDACVYVIVFDDTEPLARLKAGAISQEANEGYIWRYELLSIEERDVL